MSPRAEAKSCKRALTSFGRKCSQGRLCKRRVRRGIGSARRRNLGRPQKPCPSSPLTGPTGLCTSIILLIFWSKLRRRRQSMLHGRIFVCFGRWRELYARDKDVVKPWKARPGMQVRVGGKRRCRGGSAAPPRFSRLLPSRVGQLLGGILSGHGRGLLAGCRQNRNLARGLHGFPRPGLPPRRRPGLGRRARRFSST